MAAAVIDFESLWTAADVARYLKVSRSWVYQKVDEGLLPALRVGGTLRFEPAAIRTWLARGAPSASVIQFRKD